MKSVSQKMKRDKKKFGVYFVAELLCSVVARGLTVGVKIRIMWRSLLVLLIVLPPLAIVLNHDVISLFLIIGWTVVVIPLCVLQALDFFRNSQTKRFVLVKNFIRVPIALFGFLSFLSGVSIVVWCLYNIAVQRLPEYSGPTDPIDLWLNRFGIAPVLISFGWYLLRLSVSRVDGHKEEPYGKDGA